MTWARNQRLEFIRQHLALYGSIGREDLRRRFAVTHQTASADFAAFRAKWPDSLAYDGSRKTHIAGPRFEAPATFELAVDFDPENSDLVQLQAKVQRLESLLNSPEVRDFVEGVMRETPHQRELWGTSHDAGKTPFDWFWLIGYLAQKAAAAAVAGDVEKACHHTISTAAALANWHAALIGADTSMRPGISPPDEAAA